MCHPSRSVMPNLIACDPVTYDALKMRFNGKLFASFEMNAPDVVVNGLVAGDPYTTPVPMSTMLTSVDATSDSAGVDMTKCPNDAPAFSSHRLLARVQVACDKSLFMW